MADCVITRTTENGDEEDRGDQSDCGYAPSLPASSGIEHADDERDTNCTGTRFCCAHVQHANCTL